MRAHRAVDEDAAEGELAEPGGDNGLARYAGQIPVAGFGAAGQEKLKRATVLVTRVGGIGSAVAATLAAAGVGRLVLAQGGVVRRSDLNRNLLAGVAWLGKNRTSCAANTLQEINPHVEILTTRENPARGNVAKLVGEVDVVVDATQLFEERFLLNAEVVRQRKPMIECAASEFEGQLTTILPGQSPCLRCLYEEPPPDANRQPPTFGAVTTTVGGLAAVEVIKLLTGLGQPLAGRLLAFDLREMRFRTCAIRRDPRCPVCATAG